jgi:hypothetical protein
LAVVLRLMRAPRHSIAAGLWSKAGSDQLKQRRVLPADVRAAYDDFSCRTLAQISSVLERLVYVASTRDYNSGLYHHEGLAARFSASAAAQALQAAHVEAFHKISVLPLSELSDELEKYMKSSRENPLAFLNAWQKLQPYRVAIPMSVDPTVADLFVSNIKIALLVLRRRLLKKTDHPSGALRHPSPGPQSLPQLHN